MSGPSDGSDQAYYHRQRKPAQEDDPVEDEADRERKREYQPDFRRKSELGFIGHDGNCT